MKNPTTKACVENFERHLNEAVRLGELSPETDKKYITGLLAIILKEQAGGREPAPSKTGGTKGVGISDLLGCGFAVFTPENTVIVDSVALTESGAWSRFLYPALKKEAYVADGWMVRAIEVSAS